MPRGRSKSKATTATTRKAPPKFLTCGETGERIFAATATLADIKNPPSNASKKKILYKIHSAKTRQTLYDELALVLEDCEARRLPKYGGRPWQVICRVSDASGSPFFRWYRGKLELAVLPHLLEKIPEPPKFPGYIQTDQGVVRQVHKGKGEDEEEDEDDSEEEEIYDNMTEEEVQRMESLLSREISSLSQVAWDHRNDIRLGAPLPTISLKWTCPLRQTFTSRKAAWDHAVALAKAEQYVDRFLRGLGKTGLPLNPFRPTKAQTLQAGKVRFLRDGLWVVGQEQEWQNERYLDMDRQPTKKRKGKPCGSKTGGPTFVLEPPKKRRKIVGSMLFISLHRVAYREKRLNELKQNGKKQVTINGDNNSAQIDDPKMAKTAAKVGMPTSDPAPKSAKNFMGFTLLDAEKELRLVWKDELSPEERQAWDLKASSSFQRRIDLDEKKRWNLAEKGEEAASDNEGEEEKREMDSVDERKEEAVKLATYDERMFWDVFSEAEQEHWGRNVNQAVTTFGESRKPVAKPNAQQPPLPKFNAYQRRVFDALFAMTPEEFEEHTLKGMRASDRRRQLAEQRKQKELLAQGMKALTAPAHAVLEKRLDHWLTMGIRRAFKGDPRGTKCEEEPELKTMLPVTTASNNSQMEASSSTPISPSPPLDPMVLQSNPTIAEPQDFSAEVARNQDTPPDLPSSQQASSMDDSMEEEEKEHKEEESAEKVEEIPRFVRTNNFCLSEDQIKLCSDASMDHFDAVMRTVKARDLTRELADGFDLLRERGRGRYDMELPAFETKEFDFLNDIKKTPWMPIVRQVLGDDVVLIHKGCFLSLPDATNQNYHQDGPHLSSTSQRPCHAVNVFTPLVDMTEKHGPTEFCLGSHVLGQEDWDRRYVDVPLQKKGVPVMFDYRLGHRGLANTSKDPRPIVYCTYARAGNGKEFRDSVNFSRRRYHKLGELVDKPMSREERNKKRREQLDEQHWEEFPEAFESQSSEQSS